MALAPAPRGILACPSKSTAVGGSDMDAHGTRTTLAALALGLAAYAAPSGASQPGKPDGDAAGLVQHLGALEARSYGAWKARSTTFWASFLSDKFVGWGPTGRIDGAAAERALRGADCRIVSYRISDVQVSRLTPAAAVLTHKTEVDGTCGGRQLPPASWTATAYVREAGRWKAAFRAEAPIVDPVKMTRPSMSDLWNGGSTRRDSHTLTLLGTEQALWDAWKDRDSKRIDALIRPDIQFINIFGMHFATHAEALQSWSGEGCDVKSFNLAGASATMFSQDFGILTLRATADAACYGQTVWPVWVSSFYVKRGDVWVWSFGINIPAGAGAR